MIEIQCTSCHTRYRIDEGVLPDETPTFKCSRCGHVFNADPVSARPKKASVRDISSAAPRPQRSERAPAPPETPAPEPAAAPAAGEPAPIDEPAELAAPEPSTDDLMSRPFSRDSEDPDPGENLKFDFSDEGKVSGEEEAPETRRVRDEFDRNGGEWQVGDLPADFAPAAAATPPAPIEVALPKPARLIPHADEVEFEQPRFTAAKASGAAQAPVSERGFVSGRLPDDVAYIESRGGAHSAGMFIALFFLVAVAFGLASMVICGEPAASARMLSQVPALGARFTRPIVPATLVALRDVRAQYLPIKGGADALIVSGTAENVGNDPLHGILIAVDLLDGSARQIAGQASYCGNGLSEKMVGEMTPREIEFLQRLDPQKNFAVAAGHSAPFLMVFIDPPRQTATLRIAVAKAAASAIPAEPAPRT
ncbi:MAG TPA: zinc-ribbon domain-containing protein [Candidatus Binataceae bacterium]|nr:zinc-ribbon domain-containing protein [Candidatus Binataceae bacterium]